MSRTRNIAIFDLDYTLTKRGTWGRFVWALVRYKPWLWLPLLGAAGWTQLLYKLKLLPRIRVKQAMMHWSMTGMDRAKLTQFATNFAVNEINHGLRSGAVKAIEQHKLQNDILIIVSAAVDIIVKPMAEGLEFDHWLATNMQWQEGRLASEFASENCYGVEKVNRLEALFKLHPKLKQTDTHITFYSDSHSDVELFNICDVAIAVNPTSRLRNIARQNGWEITDWDK